MNQANDCADPPKSQSWQRQGEWSMVCGDVTISKYIVGGVQRYVRWEGNRMAGIFDSFDDAATQKTDGTPSP
jgi:hypothetical protein